MAGDACAVARAHKSGDSRLPRATPPPTNVFRSIPILDPSRDAAHAADTLLSLPDPAAARRGRVVRAFFDHVEFADSSEPDEQTLRAAAREAEPSIGDTRFRDALAEFRRLLKVPAIRAVLARPNDDFELWRRCSFAVVVDGRLIRGVFDRVLVLKSGDAAKRAELVAFETDGAGGPASDALQRHRSHLDAQRTALAHMLRLPIDAVRARLVVLSPASVIEI